MLIVAAITMPAVSFVLIALYAHQSRNSAFAAFLFGLTMSARFYAYRADIGADIYRHMEWLNRYKDLPFTQCFDAGHYKNLYVWDIWCWIISKLNNPWLLQSSAALLTYGIAAYMIFDTAKRHHMKKNTLMWGLFFMCCVMRTRDVILGIRNTAALVLIALALYRVVVQNKGMITSLVLAIAGCMIHLSVTIFLALFLILPLLKKKPKRNIAILFCATLFIGVASEVALNVIPDNGTMFSNILREGLTTAVATTEMQHTHSLNSFILKWWEIGLCFLICFRGSKFEKYYSISDQTTCPREKQEWMYGLFCFAISFGFCLSLQQNGDRFLTLNEFLMLPYFLYTYDKVELLKKRQFVVVDILIICGAIGLLLLHSYSLLWGTASSLSYWEGLLFGIVSAL